MPTPTSSTSTIMRAENVARIRTWRASKDIILAGRYSEWEYYNSDHAFLAGKHAVESLQLMKDTTVASRA